MTKITFDFDKLKEFIENLGYRLDEDGYIKQKKTTTWDNIIKGETDSVGVLFIWYNMIFKDFDWFIRVWKDYFHYANKPRRFIQFYRNMIEPYGFIWTNHSRFQMIDYHEYFRKFKTIIYIQKDPISAMQSMYFWLNKEYDEAFVKEFIKYHLPNYIAHIKWDGKYANTIIDFDSLKNNPDTLKNIIYYFDDDFNEEAFEKAYIPPKRIEYHEFSQEAKDLISEIWIREGMI